MFHYINNGAYIKLGRLKRALELSSSLQNVDFYTTLNQEQKLKFLVRSKREKRKKLNTVTRDSGKKGFSIAKFTSTSCSLFSLIYIYAAVTIAFDFCGHTAN